MARSWASRAEPPRRLAQLSGAGPGGARSASTTAPSSPSRRPSKNSPSPPLRGRCRKPAPHLMRGQRGSRHLAAYLVASGGPPLCHSVTSPPARGGEGIWEFCRGLQRRALLPAALEAVWRTARLKARMASPNRRDELAPTRNTRQCLGRWFIDSRPMPDARTSIKAF